MVYSLSKISAKDNQNRFICVEVIVYYISVVVFLRRRLDILIIMRKVV